MSLLRYCSGRWPLFVIWLALCSTASAASFVFLNVEGVFNNPPSASAIQPYAIVLSSSSRRFIALPPDGRPLLQEYFIYQTRVSVEDQTYYRLALGNFSSEKTAQIQLQRLQKSFAEAWIYRRNPDEEKQLAKFLGQARAPIADVPAPVRAPAAPVAVGSSEPPALLEQARQEFIDGNFARVIAITDRISETGDLIQVREALELEAFCRERRMGVGPVIVNQQVPDRFSEAEITSLWQLEDPSAALQVAMNCATAEFDLARSQAEAIAPLAGGNRVVWSVPRCIDHEPDALLTQLVATLSGDPVLG